MRSAGSNNSCDSIDLATCNITSSNSAPGQYHVCRCKTWILCDEYHRRIPAVFSWTLPCLPPAHPYLYVFPYPIELRCTSVLGIYARQLNIFSWFQQSWSQKSLSFPCWMCWREFIIQQHLMTGFWAIGTIAHSSNVADQPARQNIESTAEADTVRLAISKLLGSFSGLASASGDGWITFILRVITSNQSNNSDDV